MGGTESERCNNVAINDVIRCCIILLLVMDSLEASGFKRSRCNKCQNGVCIHDGELRKISCEIVVYVDCGQKS